MAINSVPVGTVLKMQFETGINGNGDAVLRTKSINNIKPSVEQQDLFDVAQALGELQQYPMVAVLRVDSAMLDEE